MASLEEVGDFADQLTVYGEDEILPKGISRIPLRTKSIPIAHQLLQLFCCSACILLGSVFLITCLNLAILFPVVQSLAKDGLEDQVKENTMKSMMGHANVYSQMLDVAQGGIVQLLGEAANYMFDNRYPLEALNGTFDLWVEDSPWKERLSYIPRTESLGLANTSTFYFKGSTKANVTDYLYPNPLTPPRYLDFTERVTTNLDPFFKELFAKYEDFVAFYVGFLPPWDRTETEVGLFRRFPGQVVDDLPIPGVPPSTNETRRRDYNHRARGWYTSTRTVTCTSSEPSDAIFTDPYVDAFGLGWMITIAMAYPQKFPYSWTGACASPKVVVGADMTVESIQQAINSIVFLRSGYAMLLTRDLKVLSHPEWNYTGWPVTEAAPDVGLFEPFSYELRVRLGSGGSGVYPDYVKNAHLYYVSYAEVGDILVLVSVVDRDEALETVGETLEKLSINASIVLVIALLVSLCTCGKVMCFGSCVAWRLSRPIRKLTRTSRKIMRNVAEEDMTEGVDTSVGTIFGTRDEVGGLTSKFFHMIRLLALDQQKRAIPPSNPYHGRDSWEWRQINRPEEVRDDAMPRVEVEEEVASEEILARPEVAPGYDRPTGLAPPGSESMHSFTTSSSMVQGRRSSATNPDFDSGSVVSSSLDSGV